MVQSRAPLKGTVNGPLSFLLFTPPPPTTQPHQVCKQLLMGTCRLATGRNHTQKKTQQQQKKKEKKKKKKKHKTLMDLT